MNPQPDWTIEAGRTPVSPKSPAGPAADRNTGTPARSKPETNFWSFDMRRGLHDRRRSKAEVDLASSHTELRKFSSVSLVAIFITSMLLVMAYRFFTLDGLLGQTGVATIQIADAAAATYHEQLANFLAERKSKPGVEITDEMRVSLVEIVLDSQIKRVRLLDEHSRLVFSTSPDDVVGAPLHTEAIDSALAGKSDSVATYRDMFNTMFGLIGEKPGDNHVQTALPLQVNHQGPVVGVFEIETEIHSLVAQNERAQLLIAATSSLLMIVLYLSLMTSIRRIQRLVDIQHHALQERSDLLAALSAEMLNVEEEEKQRIARSLHERVAQTLAAIKFGIERTSVNVRSTDEEAAQMLQSLLDPMRSAIQELRDTATDLRPSSLDDLGLLPTLHWLCNRFGEARPDVAVEQHFLVGEKDIPKELTPVIFRIAEDACNSLQAESAVKRIALSLMVDGDSMVLDIQDNALPFSWGDLPNNHPFSRVRDRAVLSGGTFAVRRNSWGGGLSVRITWPLIGPGSR
jgi:signal transduction histidine kinase